MASMSRGSATGVNRIVGHGFGAVYALVGLLGFAVSGGHDFAGRDGGKLFGLFMVNPLHNVVHLLVAALLIGGAARGEAVAARMNTLVGGVYLLLGVLGLFILDAGVNIVALNGWDNALHFVSAALLLAVGLMGARSHATARTA